MKEFKGTPGNWRYSEEYEEVTISKLGIVEGSKKICVLSLPYDRPQDERVANGKLIASAPNLLEALQELVHLHLCEQEGLSSGQPSPLQWLKAVDQASEAISKAVG